MALVKAIKATTTTTPTIPSLSTVNEKQETSKGISRSELKTKLQMYGKSSMSDMMDLPS